MTHSVIELHDSTISAVRQQDGTAIIEFTPAYIHKSENRPGIDAGTGWVQDASLRIENVTFEGSLPHLPANVMDGMITINSIEYDNIIPIPLDVLHAVTLQLDFPTGEHITVKGTGVNLQLNGECKYVEDFVP